VTLYEFRMLSDSEQLETVWDKGNFIDNAITPNHRINLYAIDMFYVEVYYDAVTNKITHHTAFIHGHRLDKYSGDIPASL